MTPEAKIQRTRAWLRYASRDLRAARDALRPGADTSPYHVAFWAQQLAAHGFPFQISTTAQGQKRKE